MREKLIELLKRDDCPLFMVYGDSVEVLADYLIANGVRMEEKQATSDKTSDENKRLIPVTERMPDRMDQYLCVVHRPIPGGKYVQEFRTLWCDYDGAWSCEGLIVTHWMPLPDAPKEG